jgi:hypothetical protein
VPDPPLDRHGFSLPHARGTYLSEQALEASLRGRSRQPMCYTRKDRDLEKEVRKITESRLMEEDVRHRQEEHDRRRAKEDKPLIEKVKEVVGVR